MDGIIICAKSVETRFGNNSLRLEINDQGLPMFLNSLDISLNWRRMGGFSHRP